MCTETFLRLPEEKRSRFLEAAWGEFTRVKFADASINQIVRHAGIPRGSFYQYFADKEDLFAYLLQGVREQFVRLFALLLEENSGDIFQMQLAAYDRIIQEMDPGQLRDRFIRVLQLNPGMDLKHLIIGDPAVSAAPLMEKIDLSTLRRTDDSFVRSTLLLSSMVMVPAVMESLARPERRAEHRRLLEEQLEIIRDGACRRRACPRKRA